MGGKTSYLTKVPRSRVSWNACGGGNVCEGDVRAAFEKVFSPGRKYILFQTVANRKAVSALRKYIGFRKSDESPWEVREIQPGDKPAYVPGARNEGNGLALDVSLMRVYRCAIDRIADEMIGQENFSHYPMVHSDNGMHDSDPQSIFWPEVYIVNSKNDKDLKGIIDNLSTDKSLELLRKLESPQFYQMGEIETLHRLGIAPISRLERELMAPGGQLFLYVDFLAQMSETHIDLTGFDVE